MQREAVHYPAVRVGRGMGVRVPQRAMNEKEFNRSGRSRSREGDRETVRMINVPPPPPPPSKAHCRPTSPKLTRIREVMRVINVPPPPPPPVKLHKDVGDQTDEVEAETMELRKPTVGYESNSRPYDAQIVDIEEKDVTGYADSDDPADVETDAWTEIDVEHLNTVAEEDVDDRGDKHDPEHVEHEETDVWKWSDGEHLDPGAVLIESPPPTSLSSTGMGSKQEMAPTSASQIVLGLDIGGCLLQMRTLKYSKYAKECLPELCGLFRVMVISKVKNEDFRDKLERVCKKEYPCLRFTPFHWVEDRADKVRMCIDLGVDLMVDDSLECILGLPKHILGILMCAGRRPSNTPHRIRTVWGWEELVEMLRAVAWTQGV